MDSRRHEMTVAVARAQRRFEGYKVDVAYPICWPVYSIRLTMTVMAEQELSTVARYILQLSNSGVSAPLEFGRLLGLPDNFTVSAAAELLGAELVVQQYDGQLAITDHGRQTLLNGGRSWQPRREHMRIPFDPLTRRVLDISVRGLLHSDLVRKNGTFVVPATGNKPRLSELRIEEIRDFAHDEEGISPEEIIEVAEFRDRDAWLRYRDGLIAVKMDSSRGDQPVFAIYNGYDYLEEETNAVQRLVDSGLNLIPEEFASSLQEPWLHSRSASRFEETLLATIKDNGRDVVEVEQAIVETQASLLDAQDTPQQDETSARLAQLEAEKVEKAEQLARNEQQLLEQSGGAIRLIKTEEHRPLLMDAMDQAASELTLVSAWIRPDAFDDECRRKLAAAINRGVTVRIAWGFGTNWNRSTPGHKREEAQNNKRLGDEALAQLERMIPENAHGRLVTKRVETHQKFIICDDLFCASGSFNWLSYRGRLDRGYRLESSFYSERSDDIALWRAQADDLFQ